MSKFYDQSLMLRDWMLDIKARGIVLLWWVKLLVDLPWR